MNPSLREIQEWLRWAITDPRGVDAALGDPRPPGLGPRYQAPASDMRRWIESRELSSRIGIYAEAYFSRIAGSLAVDFPALRRLLGEESFLRLAADYLKEHPSRYFSIGEIGRSLGAFAASHPLSDEFPMLADLARFEWAMIEAFHAPLAAPSDRSRWAMLDEADWAAAQFVFEPALVLFSSEWPVSELRSQTIDGDGRDLQARAEFLIWRRGGVVMSRRAAPAEARLLRSLMNGQPLETALEELAGAPDSQATDANSADPLDVEKWLGQWVTDELLNGIIASPKGSS